MPYRVLVVDADPEALASADKMLSAPGYLVTSISLFEEAKKRLQLAPPDLLIADVRLGAYNGLHLVIRARADHPGMPAIVTHAFPDPVLEAEAKGLGADYITKPLDATAFVARVRGLLAGRASEPASVVVRRWPRKRAAVTARLAGSEARVLDLSYGGLRLEVGDISEEGLSSAAQLSIPAVGLQLPIHPVWAKRAGPTGPWWCGVEIAAADQRTAEAWRGFVDRLN